MKQMTPNMAAIEEYKKKVKMNLSNQDTIKSVLISEVS